MKAQLGCGFGRVTPELPSAGRTNGARFISSSTSRGTCWPFPVLFFGVATIAGAEMNTFRYRLIDTAGGEIDIITDSRSAIKEGESVRLPDGSAGRVVDVYDDEVGREGDVQATLAVEE